MSLTRSHAKAVAALLLPCTMLIGSALVTSCNGELSWITTEAPGPPSAPLLSPPPSPTRATTVAIVGRKEIGTRLELDGTEILDLESESVFRVDVDLVEGKNTFEFVAIDSRDQRGPPASVTIVFDSLAPAPPSLDGVVAATAATSIELRGTKEPDTAVWLDGVVAVDLSPTPTFSVERALERGVNNFLFTTQDSVGNESSIVAVQVIRTDGSFTIDVVPTLANTNTLEITGTRSAGVAIEVDGSEVLAVATLAGPWTINVPLDVGDTTFTVSGVLGVMRWDQEFTVTLDQAAPGTPILDPLPVLWTMSTMPISGTMPDVSDLVVNGEVLLVAAPAGSFNASFAPGFGVVTLDVAARDGAGNFSPSVTPAPVVYVNPAGLVFTLAAYASTALTSPVTLTGIRGPDVDLYLGNILLRAADGNTAFSVDIPLQLGANVLTLTARAGAASSSIAIDLTLADPAPLAPVITPATVSIDQPTLTVTGTRTANTSVLRGGIVVVPAGPVVDFNDIVDIPIGSTTLSYAVRDSFGRVSPTTTIDVERVLDAGVLDAGAIDAGFVDAGNFDAGFADAGASDDSGIADAGPTDGA